MKRSDPVSVHLHLHKRSLRIPVSRNRALCQPDVFHWTIRITNVGR